MAEELSKMEKIISLCKRRGFIYQGSEIYGGLAGTWDYGPLGVALKKNIENGVNLFNKFSNAKIYALIFKNDYESYLGL